MTTAVVLAAGLGRRMKAVKPLVRTGGQPALARVLAHIREADIEHCVVVLGHAADLIRSSVDMSTCTVVVNPHPERGMASSLRQGLESVPTGSPGALIFHADMPHIQTGTIRAVLRLVHDGAVIAAPMHGAQRGFPVFFHASLLDELKRVLHGDQGGRNYIREHRALLRTVAVADPGCTRDLDTPEDLDEIIKEGSCATNA